MLAQLPPRQSLIRVLVLITWSLLLLLVIGHQLFSFASIAMYSVVTAVVCCVPLLAPLPGLLRGKRYTYSWATLCVLPYFIVGITEAVANPTIHIWALALLAASLLWFFALISFLRVVPKES